MKNNCEICKNNIPFEMPQELIEATIKGKLVLFCGAGISTENKLVLPTSFYESIKKELDEKDDSDLSFSNLMEKYCELPNGRKKLLQEIKKDSITLIRFRNYKDKLLIFIKSCQLFFS